PGVNPVPFAHSRRLPGSSHRRSGAPIPELPMKNLRSSKLKRIARETKLMAKGLASTKHPILAHVITVRLCYLSCVSCNEHDKFAEPVPLELIRARLDRRAPFGPSIITISGGEPML